MLLKLIETILHLDESLQMIASQYTVLAYALLFLIIFLETGIVVNPFLPGDSLLFVGGALAATGLFDIKILFLTVFVAAVAGDTVNYHIGKYLGPKIFKKESSWLFHKEHLLRAQVFFVE